MEERVKGVVTSPEARNNMLCFGTNFVTDDLPLQKPAGSIVVRNCNIKNADRMLLLNLSGNETWQRGTPPTDIVFENIKAENIALGLTAYGVKGSPMQITLKNVEYSFREGSEEAPLMRVAHCNDINFENVKIENYKGKSLIKAWSDNIKVSAADLDCPLNCGELLTRTDEEFVCSEI